MATGWKGIALGALGLAGMQALVSSKDAPGALGGLATGAGNVARKFLSADVPAFTPNEPNTGAANASISTAATTTTNPHPFTIPGGALA